MSQGDIYIGICDDSPVSIEKAWRFINASEHGGNSFFVGSIRNLNMGKEVQKVEYDIYDAFFKKALGELYTNLLKTYQCPLTMYIEHSKGVIHIGEPSVVVAISAPHRKESFAACKDSIEYIKHNTPIWKKEHYVEGQASGWVQGHSLCQHR